MNNKGNEKTILVKNDDKDLINASIVFFKTIEEKFRKYQNEYKKLKNIYIKGNYIKNSNYYFYLEKLTKQSPLTILNGPWGSGKTHFIENLLKLFIDKKIASDVLKKIY